MHLKKIRAAGAMALAVAALLPAAAHAASAPGVTTGGAANVAQQTARLTGSVDPNDAATTFQFQYGTTSAYGSVTPEQTIAGGNAKKTITADIGGLAPATTYHYRLIARNSKGLTKGADRTFKTKVQPLGVTFAATPNPLLPGGTTTLAGQLTGTGNGGKEVVLQSNPFPYTQGFKQDGNTLVTAADGTFNFGLKSVAFNTQYRVALPSKPSVVSPIVVVSVAVRVSTKVGTHTVTRGRSLTFKGTVEPAVDGTPIAIQKLNSKKHWVTVAGTAARHNSSKTSTYSKKVKIRSGGKYRVYAGVANGMYVPNTGATVTIHTR